MAFVLPTAAMATPSLPEEVLGMSNDAGRIPTPSKDAIENGLVPFATIKNGVAMKQAFDETEGDLYFGTGCDSDPEFMLVADDIIPNVAGYQPWMKITTDGQGPYIVEPELEIYEWTPTIEEILYETSFEDNARNYMEWGQIDYDCSAPGGYYDGWSWSDARACGSDHSFKCTMYDEYKNMQDDFLYMKDLVDITGYSYVNFTFDCFVAGEYAEWFTAGGDDVYSPLDYLMCGVIDGGFMYYIDNGDTQLFATSAGGVMPGNYYFFDTSLPLYTGEEPQDYTMKAVKIEGCPGWWHVWYEVSTSTFASNDVGMWFEWISDKERVFEGAYVDNVVIKGTESDGTKIYQGHSQNWLEVDDDTWFEFPLCWDDVAPGHYKAIVKIKNDDYGQSGTTDLTVKLDDDWGDGWWYDAELAVTVNAIPVSGSPFTLADGYTESYIIAGVSGGDIVEVCYSSTGGTYEDEHSWQLLNGAVVLLEDGQGGAVPAQGCQDVTISAATDIGYDVYEEILFEVGDQIDCEITALEITDDFSGEVIPDGGTVDYTTDLHITYTYHNNGNLPTENVEIKATAYKMETEVLFDEDYEGMLDLMGFYNTPVPYKSQKFAWSGSNSLAFNDPDTLNYGTLDGSGDCACIFSETIDMENVEECYFDHYYMGKLGGIEDEFYTMIGCAQSSTIYLWNLIMGADTKVDPWVGPMQPQCMYGQTTVHDIWDILVGLGEDLDANGHHTYDLMFGYLLWGDYDSEFYYQDEYDWSGVYVDDTTFTAKVRGEAVWTDTMIIDGPCDPSQTCTKQFVWEDAPYSCYEIVVEAVCDGDVEEINNEMSQELCILENLEQMAKAEFVDYTECNPEAWCISDVVGNDCGNGGIGDHYALATNCDTNEVPAGVNSYVALTAEDGECYGIDISHLDFPTNTGPDPVDFHETFDTEIPGDWTIVDVNGDGATWAWTSSYGNPTGCAQAIYHSTNPKDEYLYTPLLSFAGPSLLECEFTGASAFVENAAIYLDDDTNPGNGFVDTIFPLTQIVGSSPWTAVSEAFSASGDYYVAFHASTTPDQYWLNLDNIHITENKAIKGINCETLIDESFEGVNPPAGWTVLNGDFDGGMSGQMTACDGDYYFYTNGLDPVLSIETPSIIFKEETVLTFQYALENPSSSANIDIYVDGVLFDSILGASNTQCLMATIDLSSAGPGAHTVGWMCESDIGFGYQWQLDDIEIETCDPDPVEEGDRIDLHMTYQCDLAHPADVIVEVFSINHEEITDYCDGCITEDCPCPEGEDAWTPVAVITGNAPGVCQYLDVELPIEDEATKLCFRIRLDTDDPAFDGADVAGPGIGFHLHDLVITNITYDEITGVIGDFEEDFEDGSLANDEGFTWIHGCITYGHEWEQNVSDPHVFQQMTFGYNGEAIDNALIWDTEIEDAYYAMFAGDWAYDIPADCELILDMSADGGNTWYIIAKVVGSDVQSALAPIGCTPFDLTPWAGNSILIRVHVDNNGVGNGWVQVGNFIISGKQDNMPPTATISLSGNNIGGGQYAGPVSVTITGKDNAEVEEIHYILDGSETVVSGDKATFQVSTDGEHTIEYWAVDTMGNEGAHGSVSFSVDNSPPTVAITAPVPGLYLFGNKLLSMNKPIIIGAFTIEAEASDAQGVASVQFFLNGESIGADVEAPYSLYCAVKNMGAATLKVVANDGVGNSAEDSMDITYYKFL
jgi:hypothetical protein